MDRGMEMGMRKTSLIGGLILGLASSALAADNTIAPPYMGQEPPGLTPKVFAPAPLGIPNRIENDICLAKDGRECYFTVRNPGWTVYEIMVTRYEDGQWTTPVLASFSDNRSLGPSLADNDQTLYFGRSQDIWRVRRSQTASGTWSQWSQPEAVPAPISSAQDDWSCCISSLGNAWICSWRTNGAGKCDLWRIESINGQFTSATNLSSLNTMAADCNPVPGPAEDYVVWNSDRTGGFGGTDLYISFPDGRGGWTAPRNLGPRINSSKNDMVPYLSPDHKYLFFCREDTSTNTNIYWVRVEAFLPDPNGPVYNLSTGQRFASIQTAVNYVQSGQVILLSPGTYKENLILPNTALTIRSANSGDSAVVALTSAAGDGASPVITLMPGTALRSLQGLTIMGGADGIACPAARLQLSSCVVTSHRDCGIKVSDESTLGLDHCILAGNAGSGLRSVPKTTARGQAKVSKVDVTQCTVTQNRGYGLEGDGITVANSIVYGNGISTGGVQIKGANVKVSYSDVQAGFAGQGNLDGDPLFVAPGAWSDPNTYVLGDCHLKSKAGHWSARTCSWVVDDTTSPCIDAGDPNTAFGLEPAPNGGRSNLGAYGNTTDASRSAAE
jgi:hypothetical protein